EKVTTAPAALVASTVIGAGQVTTGAVVSWIVTANDPAAMFPAASLAEHCTVVVPSEKILPLGGEQVTMGLAGLLSEALVANTTTAPDGPVASRVKSDGRLNAGGVVSPATTTMISAPAPGSIPKAEASALILPV